MYSLVLRCFFLFAILNRQNMKSVLSLSRKNGKIAPKTPSKIDTNTQYINATTHTNQAYIKYIRSYDTKLFERNRKSCFFVDPLSFDYSKLLGNFFVSFLRSFWCFFVVFFSFLMLNRYAHLLIRLHLLLHNI